LEILYLLLPLSFAIIALVGGTLWWAVFSGQYDDPDAASQSILLDDDRSVSVAEQPHSDELSKKRLGNAV
jgi:cbb3-type cytochrome oxidase maturation protein